MAAEFGGDRRAGDTVDFGNSVVVEVDRNGISEAS